jgi:hypothetical protein
MGHFLREKPRTRRIIDHYASKYGSQRRVASPHLRHSSSPSSPICPMTQKWWNTAGHEGRLHRRASVTKEASGKGKHPQAEAQRESYVLLPGLQVLYVFSSHREVGGCSSTRCGTLSSTLRTSWAMSVRTNGGGGMVASVTSPHESAATSPRFTLLILRRNFTKKYPLLTPPVA